MHPSEQGMLLVSYGMASANILRSICLRGSEGSGRVSNRGKISGTNRAERMSAAPAIRRGTFSTTKAR